MTDDTTQLQKQDLLLKMLNMTTSDNDNMALVAIRKANALLQGSGWTWEKLLSGKITIIEDPFKAASPFDSMLKKAKEAPPPAPSEPPKTARPSSYSTYSAMDELEHPLPRQRTAQAAKRNRTVPTPRSMGRSAISTKDNAYAGPCYCCGDHVDVRVGFIFRPSDFNGSAPNRWAVVCAPCNKKIDQPIARSAAPRTGRAAGLRNTTVNVDSL